MLRRSEAHMPLNQLIVTSCANACVTFTDNVMAEAVAREHGVGTHCDFGGFEAAVPPATRTTRS
jgi:hypothetical protein